MTLHMKGEGSEPKSGAAGADVARRLNLRPFKRETENTGEDIAAPQEPQDAAAQSIEEAETAEFAAEAETMEDTPDEEHEGQNETINNEEDPFFAPDDEEESKPPKRMLGELRREDIRRKKRITEKEKRLRQRRKKLIKLVILIMAAVLLITSAVLTYFMLIVDSIEIYGCEHYDAEELIKASGLSVGKHIWLERIDEAENRMKQNSYIASAVITRVYPDKLVINITEREEAAVLVGMNTQAVIDNEGYVLYIGARADYSGLIQISGMGSSGYHVNQKLGEESDFNSRTLIALLDAVYSAGLEKEIISIDLGNPLSINMETASGMKIHIGQPDGAEQKLADFKTVLPTLKAKGLASSGTLDLSAQGDPVYSPQKTPDAATPMPTPDASNDPAATPAPDDAPVQSTPAPSSEPVRTPGITDAFSG